MKISDVYKEKIDRYMNEYENFGFSNNFNEKLQEIIEKAIATSADTTPVDNYVQCHVCHQSCKDIHLHQRDNYQPYEQMFRSTIASLPLEQIIGSDIWDWKAVDRTSIYLPIWNAREKWNQLSRFISQLEEPVRILCNKCERYWTMLIDRYEQQKSEFIQLPRLLSQTVVVNYLPDSDETEKLKIIFDQYDREEQRNVFSKLQNNDQRIESGNYYLIATTIKNRYIDHEEFSFPIADPPAEIYGERCSDCLMYKRIPHLGFIAKPVRICQKCSDEKQHLTYQHLFTYVKHLIESNRLQYVSIYLALLYQYRTHGNELFYRETGEYYYQTGQYLLALQCFSYARLDSNEWFQYAIEFCEKNEYSLSFTCMELCTKQVRPWFYCAMNV